MDQSKGGSTHGENKIQLTLDQAARCGVELKRLVRTASFETCIEVLKTEYHQRVFNSRTVEREERELAYLEAQALDQLLNTMQTMIAIYESQALVDEDSDDDTTH